MTWPNDVDGDVFRKLQSRGFDFTKEYDIDFNVEFDNWPPAIEAVNLLRSKYKNVEIEKSEDPGSGNGYITFQIRAKVTYGFVMQVQAEITQAMRQYQGRCESWGTWGHPPDLDA